MCTRERVRLVDLIMKRNILAACFATLAVIVIGIAEYNAASNFGEAEKAMASLVNRPSVTFTRPANGESSVLPNSFVSCDVNLPNPGHGIDAETMNSQSIRLTRARDGKSIAARFNTSGAGDAIVCQPIDLLEPSTQYTFEVTGTLSDTSGSHFAPFKMTFTTAAGSASSEFPVAFEKVLMPDTKVLIPGTDRPSAYTALTIGPDGKLYAATFDGRIFRFAIARDGALADRETISTVQAANHGPRLITGITFDPHSTASNPTLWVSHGQMAINQGRIEGADDWTGKISTIAGPNLSDYHDVVVGLPRAYKDHLNFQMAFGPDGALYFCQGSDTSTGAPDKKWNFRAEHMLTAACLRLEPKLIANAPLDVKTEDGGSYDPAAPGAPLTIYATGVRCGFDLLWHSNGNLYCGMNGGAAGGNTPAGPNCPAITNIQETTEDLLLRIEKDRYYGHPNPTRNQFVLMGGNPTSGVDPQEITEYPVGTMPEKNWQPPAYDFGKSVSPNGLLEYRGDLFNGALDHKILVTRYSGGKDIIVLTPGPDGNITEAITGIDGFTQFSDPLDLAEDLKSGNIYVAEYGGRQITLLRPRDGATSHRVFRQSVTR
jgi:glucose/arabinose dehydrogenase